ncbi:MAG: hypothetical protein KA207_14495 [Burkholderiaceae bacterium]|nr:hypothetical protein [Burkholderiaceae bacterium]
MSALSLNYRRRIALLVAVRWSLVAILIGAWFWVSRMTFVFQLFLTVGLSVALHQWELSVRRQFIRDASFPVFLQKKVMQAHPGLSERDVELVFRGLRQFFMAHLRSHLKFVAMPSKVVDTAWHEFILHTKAYQQWCQAAFGRMLHHTPAEVLGRDSKRNDGLRRSWFWSCKEESIDPRKPTRLPLLFALDAKFCIEGGFSYVPDCKDIDQQSGSTAYCGTDFSASSDAGGAPGDAGGFGASEASSADGGSDGGCGGGCGGGGD